MKIIKMIFDEMVMSLSGLVLYLLIWIGVVLYLLESGKGSLAIILLISGFAWTYKEMKLTKQDLERRKKQ